MLLSLLTYILSLFPILDSTAMHIEKLESDFLLGALGDNFKFHLENWEDSLSTNSIWRFGCME